MNNSPNPSPSQRPRPDESPDSGILNERVLLLLFQSLQWDIHTLCNTASVNRKLRAIAKRLLWRELCVHRAPNMTSTLTYGSGRVLGGWDALAKLMFYCGGCYPTRHFKLPRPSPGHFVDDSTRFSKTSGRSFLVKWCRGDLLYVSDLCEHKSSSNGDDDDDDDEQEEEEENDDVLGVYRGVFGSFTRSRTRECLIRRRVGFEEGVRCPYCGARVWSMTAARMVPRSAARRLGCDGDDELDYFVCLNGHLHGACWLVPLTSDEGGSTGGGDDGGGEGGSVGGSNSNNHHH